MSDTMIDAGDGRQVPISRRSALRTGGLAAIMAGLLGTAGTAAAAPLTIPTTLAPVVSTDDLAADVMRLLAEYHQYRDEFRVADLAFTATLSAEQRALHMRASDANSNGTSVWHELVTADMARHAPGLAPVIRLLWLHVMEHGLDAFGACCTPAAGYQL